MRREQIRENAPPSGRRDTLLSALEALHDATDGGSCHIVEVGTTRNLRPRAMIYDGWATRLFAWYAHESGGRLTTIDTNQRAIQASKKLCQQWASAVTWVHGDARTALAGIDSIDLLYMDAVSEPTMHMEAWQALTCRPALVLWDDIVTPGDMCPGAEPGEVKPFPPPGETRQWAVKGALAIPAMLSDGYQVVFARDRQVLLR